MLDDIYEIKTIYSKVERKDMDNELNNDAFIQKIKDEIGGSQEERYKELINDGINEELAKKISSDKQLYNLYEKIKFYEPSLKQLGANVLANEISYLIKKYSVKSLPDDVSGLVEILQNYKIIPDHETAVGYLKKWTEGEKVKVSLKTASKDEIHDSILKTIAENNDKIKNLEYSKKFEFLMGTLIKKFGKENKKVLVEELTKALSEAQ